MNKFKKPLIIIVIAVFVLGILKDQIIKTVVTIGASSVLGAPVHIDGMSVGIFRHTVRIRGFKVHNPRGFERGLLVDVPVITVNYDLPAILKGDMHFSLLVLDLKEMTVIRSKEGKLNVDALRVAQKRQEAAVEKPAFKPTPLRIDVATINLGKVIVKDYTKGNPLTLTYDIGIKNKTYKDIKNAEQFIALVMVEAMKPAAIRNAAIYGVASVLGVAFLPAAILYGVSSQILK